MRLPSLRLPVLALLLFACAEPDFGAEVGGGKRSDDCSGVALPESRNTDYTPSDAVKANDLNDLQDGQIGAKHGSVWEWVNPTPVRIAGGGNINPSASGMVTADAGTDWKHGLQLKQGTTITDAAVRIQGAAPGGNPGAAIYFRLYLMINDGSGGANAIAEFDYLDMSNAWQTLAPTGAAALPYTLAAGESAFWAVEHENADQWVSALGIEIKRL